MIEYYATALLLYKPAVARRNVLSILPAKYHSVFLRHCGLIEQVVARRKERYAYPPAYSRVQAFASEALPPPASADAAQPSGEAAPVSRKSPPP
jgi:hypothetical protein